MIDLIQLFAEKHATNARRVSANKLVKGEMKLRLEDNQVVRIPWEFACDEEKYALLDRVVQFMRKAPVRELTVFHEAWYADLPIETETGTEAIKQAKEAVSKCPVRDRPDKKEGVFYYYENWVGEIFTAMAPIETKGNKRVLGFMQVSQGPPSKESDMSHFFRKAKGYG